MSVESSNQPSLVEVFRALADPVRLTIFQWLRCCDGSLDLDSGEVAVGDVCCQVRVAPSTVSHHLKELRRAGLIRTRKQGRTVYCSVDPEGLERLRRFASQTVCTVPRPAVLQEEHGGSHEP